MRSVAQSARCTADALFMRPERVTGAHKNPCVGDTFAAAIYQARGGKAFPWWRVTRERKRRGQEGSFVRDCGDRRRR